jgi:galactokinase
MGQLSGGRAFRAAKGGLSAGGADALYHDELPHGGGLSSSAAIQVATALAFAALSGAKPIDRTEMALIGQRSENNYVGVNCGIMDQFTAAHGKRNCALLLDCNTLDFTPVPMKMDGCKILVSNTNKKRSLADSKYNERRGECDAAFAALKAALPDKTCLCAVAPEEFEAHKHLIESETVRRRAKHAIYENARVLESAAALEAGDLSRFGRLMNASHDSLRDDYEVTGKELDSMVRSARKIPGVLGSRMTGAGFGGCTVTLIRAKNAEEYKEKVGAAYEAETGLNPDFYVFEIGDGARELPLE